MIEESERRPSRRPQRMADLIREEIANFLIKGNKDPRIGFVTITEVKMTPDLDLARVYYTAYGSEAEKSENAEGLSDSTGKIRRHLGSVLRLRFVPRIEFFFDEGLEKSYRVQDLLSQVAHGKPVEDTDDDADDNDLDEDSDEGVDEDTDDNDVDDADEDAEDEHEVEEEN